MTACALNKQHHFIRGRKLELIRIIVEEARQALEDKARDTGTSHISQDLGYELISGKWEMGGFSGLS